MTSIVIILVKVKITKKNVLFSDGESVSSADEDSSVFTVDSHRRSEARDSSILGEDHKEYQNESHA